jgi:hypothetical protein
MEYTHIPQQAYKYQPSGKWDIDRPRRRWKETTTILEAGTGDSPNPWSDNDDDFIPWSYLSIFLFFMSTCEVEFLAASSSFDNPLKTSGNYMYRLLEQEVALHFLYTAFAWFSMLTVIISLNNVNQLIFVMVKCGVLFEVRTGFLNNI